MHEYSQLIFGSVLAGQGLILAALGHRIIRMHSLTFSVWVFSALGCALGAYVGSPILALALTGLGALAGWGARKVMFYVSIACAALIGGAVLGQMLAIWTGFSSPTTLTVATAVGVCVISMMEVRAMTIFWTAAAGAALGTAGILISSMRDSLLSTPGTVMGAASFLTLFVAGCWFQHRTNPVEAPVEEPAPSPSHVRL